MFKIQFLIKVLIVLFSLTLGLFLFNYKYSPFIFFNPYLSGNTIPEFYVSGYLNLSQTIFLPHGEYYSESILLPLIAYFLKLNSNSLAYASMGAWITLSILPCLALSALSIDLSPLKVVVLVMLYAFLFRYLTYFDLGYPDPLTICCLNYIALSEKKWLVFCITIIAGLTHFSLALAAIILVCMILISTARCASLEKIIAISLGIFTSKLLLLTYYKIFDFNPSGRIYFVFEKGLGYFLGRYNENPIDFLLLPGKLFLFIYILIIFYFLLSSKKLLAAMLFATLLLTYLITFITVDGLRIFSVLITGPLVLILVQFLDSVFNKYSGRNSLKSIVRS